MYGYLNYKQTNPENLDNSVIPNYKLVKELEHSPLSYTLIHNGGGLALPSNNTQLPDVFLDNI